MNEAVRNAFEIASTSTERIQAGFTTAPERIQRVHTFMRTVFPPASTVLTRCRFGNQRRLVLLWAWLTLLPVAGPLPQISHLRAIVLSPQTDIFFTSCLFYTKQTTNASIFLFHLGQLDFSEFPRRLAPAFMRYQVFLHHDYILIGCCSDAKIVQYQQQEEAV